MRYLWVIGGGLLQIPLIKEARELDLGIIVSDANPDCAARGEADVFVELDIFDVEGHIQHLKNNERLPIAGVLAAGIDAPETMAAMNEFLGYKGVSGKTADVTKNKHLFRERLKSLGYTVPGYIVIERGEDVSQLGRIELLRFPVIVKPVNNSASRDMKIFDTHDGEFERFIQQKLEKYPLLMVEELWRGKEQTVECLVDINGQFHRGFITDRHFMFDEGYPVERGLVHPTELGPEMQEELYELAYNLSRDFEVTAGAVKLDTIVTDDGPRIIEMTVRHSGGFDCQYLVPLSTGKNILKAAILTAIQQPFDPALLNPQFERYGRTASVWPVPGKVVSINGVDEARKIAGVEGVFLRYDVGDVIEPYIDCAKRVLFIIATGGTRKDVNATIDAAVDAIHIETV